MRARRAVIALLALAWPLAPLHASAAEVAGVEEFDGTFSGSRTAKDVSIHKTESRQVSEGKLHLVRDGEEWFGTAEGKVTVRIEEKSPQETRLTTGEGRSTGEARLRFLSDGRYELRIKLSPIADHTTITYADGRTHSYDGKVDFESPGTFYAFARIPETGTDLKDTYRADRTVLKIVQWDLHGSNGLDAVAEAPAVTRGAKTHFDASKSKPREKIRSYRWKLEPGADCPPGAPSGTFEGEQADILLLCTMKATLTISDGTREKTATATAAVKARTWKTDVPKNQVGPWTKADHLRVGCVIGRCQMGKNVCALHGADDTHDIVHYSGSGSTYEKDAYVLAPVTDPKSPFDGWTWVSENKSRIHRKSLLNPELLPGSVTAAANRGSAGYTALVESVKAHEQFHTDVYREQLQEHGDPAPKMEALIGKEHDPVRQDVDKLFFELSTYFSEHYEGNEQKVHARMKAAWNRNVIVKLRKGESTVEFGDYNFEGIPLSDLGD